MKLKWVILLVLAANFASAENIDNYNDVSYLDVELTAESGIDLVPKTAEYEFGYLRAEMKYYPVDDLVQDLADISYIHEPKATINGGVYYLTYTWRDLRDQDIKYGYNADVKVVNRIVPVTRKVNFPLRSLDREILEYTKPTEFIDVNEDIEAKAKEIIGDEDDLYKAVFKVAEWTKGNIEYSLTTLTSEAVYPSSWVFENKKGVCDELTNLFISMLRSVGIPARFISGVVYTNIGYNFGNHGWAEVYFPGYGWVPFDVTYGQFGWIDPSHVKLKEDFDSGTSAVDYRWATQGIDIEIGEIDIKTKIKDVGGKLESPLDIEITPLKGKAGFGSYVPMEVKIKNTKDHYVPAQITVTKAPGLIGDNVKEILLDPHSDENLYWLLEIPSNLEKEFIYTAKLEVKDYFGKYSGSEIIYGENFDKMPRNEADEFMQRNTERETKEVSKDIGIICDTDKDFYYEDEGAKIICTIQNSGENTVLDVCLLDQCGKLPVQGGGTASIGFDLEESYDGRLTVIAENSEKVAYENLNLEIVKIPKIEIVEYSPKEAEYKEEININVVFQTNVILHDVNIIAGRNSVFIDRLEGREDFEFEIDTRDLLAGFRVRVKYHDEKGQEYKYDEKLPFLVKNLSFRAKVKIFFLKLF